MEEARLVLDYIQALAYPTVILILVGGSILLFRVQLRTFIGTVREASFGPATIRADPQVTDQNVVPEGGSGDETLPANMPGGTVPLDDWLQVATERKILSDQLYFERVYRAIYGSQLRAVQFLELERKQGPGRRLWTRSQVCGFHIQHRESTPRPLPLDLWFRFLTPTTGFIAEVTVDGYAISERGRQFLFYLLEQKIPAVRPY